MCNSPIDWPWHEAGLTSHLPWGCIACCNESVDYRETIRFSVRVRPWLCSQVPQMLHRTSLSSTCSVRRTGELQKKRVQVRRREETLTGISNTKICRSRDAMKDVLHIARVNTRIFAAQLIDTQDLTIFEQTHSMRWSDNHFYGQRGWHPPSKANTVRTRFTPCNLRFGISSHSTEQFHRRILQTHSIRVRKRIEAWSNCMEKVTE